jgi:drug/metabolite transporter (DMT)-like permease
LSRPEASDTNTNGILLKVISVSFFVLMAALIKESSKMVPAGEAVFFRSFFALPIIFGWLWLSGHMASGLKVVSFFDHFWRGLVGTLAMAFMFLGLGLLPLPEVTAISYSAPILTVVFAAAMLREKVRLIRFAAVFMGFIGVLIILYPRLSVISLEQKFSFEARGALYVLLGATFMALAHIFIRKLTKTETASAIVFYFTISSCFWSALTMPFGWVIPNMFTFGILLLAGLLGGFGQIFLTTAYKYSEASMVAPFEYISILFAIVLGYFVFGELPTLTVLVGSLVVISAGILIIWREHRLGVERNRTRVNLS